MPVINPAACRDHPHTLNRMYLYVYRPATIFAAQINGGGVDPGYDVQAIPFDNVTTGVIGDVERGYTAWIGSAPGLKDYGIIRVRSDGVGATVDVSEHEIYLYDNAYVTVKEEYRLWHVSPFLDVTGPTWYKDCDDVTAPAAIAFPGNIDDIYQPVPVMGPHSIEFLAAGVATHNFDWRNSWTISPNSGALTYAATFPGGTPPNSALSNGTVTWDTSGERWVTLSLTDDMGANPDVAAYDAHRLYVTLDRDNLPDNVYVAFQPGPRQGTVDQGGFSMQFTVFVDASEDDFPDEALVIWFFDEGTQADIGGNWPYRTHIKFVGYITKASTHKEPETGNVVFTATTIEGMMKAAPTFPNFMEDEAAPTVWTEAHDLTVQRAAYLHMRWMSSLLEMADVLFVPDADTTIGEHEFPEGFLYDQLNGLVNRDYLYRIGCDPLSTIYFNKDPQFLPRPAAWQPPAGIATIMTIESEDWREEIDLPEPLVLQTAHILASGNAYAAGALTPLFSHAPGPVPLERGRRDKSLSRLICTTQGAINSLSGLALAQANNDFPDVPLKMDGQYYIGHLFPMEFVELDIQGLPLPGGVMEGTKRDVDLSGEKFIPRRSILQVVYDSDGALSQGLVDINVEKVTYGPVGRTLTYPTEPPSPPGPEGPPNGPWLPPTPPPPSPDACSALAASHSISGPYWRAKTDTDWTARSTGLASTAFLDLIWDPWWFTSDRAGTSDPDYVILWGCGDGFIVRSGQDAGLTWTDVTPTTNPPNTWADATAPTASTVTYKQLHADIYNLDTFYVLVEWQEPGGDWRGWVAKTTDNGVSWSWTTLGEMYGGGGVCSDAAFDFTGAAMPDSTWIGTGQEMIDCGYGAGIGTCGVAQEMGTHIPGTGVVDVSCGGTLKRTCVKLDLTVSSPAAGTRTTLAVTRGWWGAGSEFAIRGYDGAWNNLGGPSVLIPFGTTYTEIALTAGSNVNTDAELWTFSVTCGVAALADVRPLAMDLDTEDGTRLYITLWSGEDKLYVQRRRTSDLAMMIATELGTATAAQVANKTYFIVPRCVHVLGSVDGDQVYMFGRWNDGADQHLAYSNDGADSFVDKADVSWGAAHRVGAFDVFYNGTTLYAFVNHATTPRLWETLDAGTNWTNLNSVPFNVEFEALTRCTWADDEFAAGSNAAQAIMAARLVSPFTGAWTDVTDSLPAGAGVISAIIWV